MAETDVTPILACALFLFAWMRLHQAPVCVDCQSKFRHKTDCRTRR